MHHDIIQSESLELSVPWIYKNFEKSPLKIFIKAIVFSNVQTLFQTLLWLLHTKISPFHFLARDYELNRADIVLEDIIGEGQFGDVHRGTYKCKVCHYC